MTIADLAIRLNTTVPELIEHYKNIFIDIPDDENYILSTELIKKADPSYNENDELKIEDEVKLKRLRKTSIPVDLGDYIKTETPEESELQNTDVINHNKEKQVSDNFNIGENIEQKTKIDDIFKKSDKTLLKEIKERNNINSLLISGIYEKVNFQHYGFFKDIKLKEGGEMYYPISYGIVNKVFIPSDKLQNNKRYLFEASLSKKYERTKQSNPYLLEAKIENIEEIIELNDIIKELEDKKQELNQLYVNIIETETQFEVDKKLSEEKIEKELIEKQKEANEIIEEYNQRNISAYNQIKIKESELMVLSKNYETTNKNILKMEKLLNTLKNRVSLCRNLQFISEDDENKYLNLLSAKDYKPANHLDFESDFENSFSQLSDHIHAYLYHNKNLIYTRHQIRNFLTLLKTHDIIVLSGLSGSGKTQIVKAFAESLGGVAKIIPVKPNWTSSDDLIGYYNPLQMSFLPTPFTEAIVEAIHNPNQLYFICLDEMNLARAEYYFADFLSKLEERSKPPEIELYANHEEELFVSEFSTLLNLIESSIKGKKIKSWQEFLANEEARNKFYDMLGNTDKESMLQLHAKMKRRLIDILKFPSTIKIPDNVRFIGAINVDETTHYFSPKILDRIHIVKFENPLLFEEEVNNWFMYTNTEKELIPVYVQPNLLSERKEYPPVNSPDLSIITQKLKDINQNYLLPLNIDFGIRSIRQSLNYIELNKSTYNHGNAYDISLNTVILQKILPRFIFDASETARNNKSKMEVIEEFQRFLSNEFGDLYDNYESDETDVGKVCSKILADMIEQAKRNSNSQFNFFA